MRAPTHDQGPAPASIVTAFPEPGRHLALAYRELHIAATGTADQVLALGDLRRLPRPWDPATCTHPDLRHDLWVWLERVVTWVNTQHVWDAGEMIPACWPHHPHLVRDLSVLADQRRRAGTALTSDPLEEWHRYALPAFTERTRNRIKTHCEDGHQTWPAKGRFARHTGAPATADRGGAFRADVRALQDDLSFANPPAARLHVVDDRRNVDPKTGEVVED